MSDYAIPRLKDIALNDRPQERLARMGASCLSDRELIAMLLRNGNRDLDVMALANLLLSKAGSLSNLIHWSEQDFRAIHGIGQVKALQLLAIMEVARRLMSQNPQIQPVLDSAESVFRLLYPIALGESVEKFWILCLNRKNRLLKKVTVTSGTATASLVHPREAFREAIRMGATAVVAAHNHPSGDPSPSQADLTATSKLKEASSILDIPMLDHVIIGIPRSDPLHKGYYSFSENGLIP